jgi:hypothetical protein
MEQRRHNEEPARYKFRGGRWKGGKKVSGRHDYGIHRAVREAGEGRYI